MMLGRKFFQLSTIWSPMLGMILSTPLASIQHKSSLVNASTYFGMDRHESTTVLSGGETVTTEPNVAVQMQLCSDDVCKDVLVTASYLYSPSDPMDEIWCYDFLMPPNQESSFYARIVYAFDPRLELAITFEQTCTPYDVLSGMQAIFRATSSFAIKLNFITAKAGVKILPTGGSHIAGLFSAYEQPDDTAKAYEIQGLSKSLRRVNTTADMPIPVPDPRPADPEPSPLCTDFKWESYVPIWTNPIAVSSSVDCRTSPEPCSITLSRQHTTTISMEWSLGAGVSIGPVNIGSTFGQEYTDRVTTTVEEGHHVPIGQVGILVAASDAAVFQGQWNYCPPDQDRHASVLVPKKGRSRNYVVMQN